MKKDNMNLKASKGGYIGGFRGRKEKGEIMQLYYNLKSKRNKTKKEQITPKLFISLIYSTECHVCYSASNMCKCILIF